MSAAGPVARIDAGLPLDATLIDCDVHTFVPGPDALRPHLAAQWAEYAAITGFTGLPPLEMSYPSGAPTTLRPDLAALDRQDSPVAALDLMRARVLDPWGATGAILNCAYPLGSITNPDLCEAMASALNDWLVADWLEPDRRLRASLLVPPQFPELAVREIHRVGDHPGFVQVLLPVRGAALYGNRRFHPVFEAAAQHGLVVGIHFGGYAMGAPPTASGWPSYYIEEYAGMAAVFQSQVRSIVFEGVFDRCPSARIALLESGFAWLPALMWRMDCDWRDLRRETPWLRRPPSEYVREHVRLALQPVDAPSAERSAALLYEQFDAGHFLMFSTDYPHWHYDLETEAIPAGLGASALHRILGANALEFYDWTRTQ